MTYGVWHRALARPVHAVRRTAYKNVSLQLDK